MPAARLAHRLASAWPLLLLFGLACFLFRDVLHRGLMPFGSDLIVHYSREQVLRAVSHARQWPFWNPYEFGGFPLWADPQTGLLYPMTLLRGLRVPAFLTWTYLLHIWLFGAGGYLLTRSTGCRREVAAIAGIALMFGGVLVPRVYAGHVDLVRTAAWTPLILALAIRSFTGHRLLPSPALVIAVSCQALGGWLQHAIYDVAVLTLYALFCVAWPAATPGVAHRRWAPAAQLIILGVLVAGLTAMQTLPTLELVQAGGRTAGVAFDEATRSSVPLRDLFRVMWPPHREAIPFEIWETSAYAGWLLPLLVPFAFGDRARRRHVIFFTAIGVLALALATGGPLYRVHYWLLPMFRLPGRLIAFWTIAVVVCGAAGLEWIAGRLRSRQVATATLALIGVLTIVDVARYAQPFIVPLAEDYQRLQRFPVPLTPGGRALSLCENRVQPLELVSLRIPTVDGYNPYFLAGMARYASRVRQEAPRRFYMSFPRIGEGNAPRDLSLLTLMNVTEVLSCAPIRDPAFTLSANVEGMLAYHNGHAAGRVLPLNAETLPCSGQPATGPDSRPLLTTGVYRGDRFDGRARTNIVAARATGVLLAEPYYPGRRAFVDGQEVPVARVYDALTALCLPAGSHVVELRYDPRRMVTGAAVTLVTAGAWAAVLIGTRRRRDQDSADQPAASNALA